MEDIASVEFRGEPPSVYSFVGLRLAHGDNLTATATWDNDAGVATTLESRGTILDLLPPTIDGKWTSAGVDPAVGAWELPPVPVPPLSDHRLQALRWSCGVCGVACLGGLGRVGGYGVCGVCGVCDVCGVCGVCACAVCAVCQCV
jgi:hypothetical protein